MYAATRVTTHPCSEHVESLSRMCGLMGNVEWGGVIFCALVSEVELSCGPELSELFLCFFAAEPVEVHVHGLGFACNYGLVVYPYFCLVVELDGSFGLWQSHFDEFLAQWEHFFGYVEEACQFSFGVKWHDVLDDFCNRKD